MGWQVGARLSDTDTNLESPISGIPCTATVGVIQLLYQWEIERNMLLLLFCVLNIGMVLLVNTVRLDIRDNRDRVVEGELLEMQEAA